MHEGFIQEEPRDAGRPVRVVLAKKTIFMRRPGCPEGKEEQVKAVSSIVVVVVVVVEKVYLKIFRIIVKIMERFRVRTRGYHEGARRERVQVLLPLSLYKSSLQDNSREDLHILLMFISSFRRHKAKEWPYLEDLFCLILFCISCVHPPVPDQLPQ